MLLELKRARRALLRRPGFTSVAVVSLALGIAAPAAVYSAVRTLMFAPLPYPHAERIVELYTTAPDGSRRGVSLLEVADWSAEARSFDRIAGYRARSFALTGPAANGEDLEVVQAGMTTAGLFEVLGLPFALGRGFTADEERADARLVVLSWGTWHERFGAASDALGQQLRLNDVPYTVVGVLPRECTFDIDGHVPAVWIPVRHADYGASRRVRALAGIGRVTAGMPLAAARAELDTIAAGLAHQWPETNAEVGADLEGVRDVRTRRHRAPLMLAAGAALILFVVACANVAGLLLERTVARAGEMAVRGSLGATARQVALPFVAEGAWLAGAGAILGGILAGWLVTLLPTILALLGGAERLTEHDLAALRARPTLALVAAAAAVIVTGILAIAPAWVAARADLASSLRRFGQPVENARGRRFLIVGQVALSAALLLSSGLLVRSFVNLIRLDPGFETAGVVRFGIGLPEVRYDERAMATFHARLVERLGELPGVTRAAAVFRTPLSGGASGRVTTLADARPSREWPRAAVNIATPGYFATLGIPLLGGRDFAPRDDADAPRVAMVDTAFVEAHFPDRDPLGQRVRLSWRNGLNPAGTEWEIVGVVGSVRAQSLERPGAPTVYLPMGQFPAEGCHYVLATERPAAELAGPVNAAVTALDPRLQTVSTTGFDRAVRRSLGERRLGLGLAVALAGVALGLSAVGLYALVATTASRQRREWAVRAALGAGRADILCLVLRRGLVVTGQGLLLGLVGALAASRLLAGMLYGVGPFDLPTALAVALVLGGVALVACLAPARRAASTAPIEALRQE